MRVMDHCQNHTTSPQFDQFPDYHSVEVPMDELRLAYQFKLWRSDHNSMFLLVKENSDFLQQLKVGNILPMKYYGSNALAQSEVKRTQIQKIINEKHGRFRGHHRVELTIIDNNNEISALQPQSAF